ncbi:hypothetical protein C2S53_008883 [Perilla frutescens var. hirtella]|uniref:BZIP domain-containing protein n=1 Tax=Perilla frutescens var. hirtella TaxID=608512 RepID=A0AAD4PA17_PERFH|nr:hypothetical protein C2S53_008883 [Perilla frutescens var. hirtella]
MSEVTVVAVDPPTDPPPELCDFASDLQIPPLDDGFFSQHIFNGDGATGENGSDDVVVLEDLDFDFSFDDLGLPPAEDFDHLLNPSQLQQSHSLPGADPDFDRFATNYDQMHAVFKSSSLELRHLSGDGDFSVDRSCYGSGILNSASQDTESQQISGYLNMPSPESNGSNRGSTEHCDDDGKGLNCHSPESQDSGNFESNVSEDSNNCVARSVSSSPNSSDSSVRNSVVDQKIKLEEPGSNNSNISLLKRKKLGADLTNSNSESRINKYRKSNCNAENNSNNSNNSNESNDGLGEEEEKKKARLLRNRESAQLSRQRKKHYVEELEDKVRNMHSTIQDLNAKISYFMAENATLRQQMGGGGAAAAASPPVAPPPMAPPPPGMYTHPAMMYPWMPYAQPYMMKSQGSQVPLVPIPRLKPQQPAQAPKTSKKVESKKSEGPKTKKVAGVSFLGLLFFIMLFGGLAPMVNVRYGGAREAFSDRESYIGGGFNENHRGRVLMVNDTEFDEKHGGRIHHGQRGQGSPGDPSGDESFRLANGSEPLAASLYVPRNDKLVKIDGNLIIHSVLASEKAMASNRNGGGETGLAVPGDLAPAIPGQDVGRNGARHPLLRALGAVDKDSMKSTATDGRLQQWFREGLAGPMLSAGMCTEVFQFDTSAAASGAIVPASTSRNISEVQNKNSTQPSKARNRRILHPLPIPESSHNHTGRRSEKEDLNMNKNASSMVVSVLFDPREASDADVDGVMGTKSLSRIFVVVLMDSVRYVTYSCMLPFKGAAPHLVTA